MMLRHILILLLLSTSGSAAFADGTERVRVRKGDTLELLAAEYYGNRKHKIFIMVENGLDHDRTLRPGERLRIPVSQQVTTGAGDTLAGLAETYLGDAKRAGYLAEFNRLKKGTTLAVGQVLVIPMRVSYRAKGNEKLRNVALGLFADAKQTQLLRSYNFLEKDQLRPGQVISVPVAKVAVQPSKLRPADADSKARSQKRLEMSQKASVSLPRAQAAWLNGDFQQVKATLTKLDTDYLDTAQATEAGILLGATYVAFDDLDSARVHFNKVRQRHPEYQLDKKQHSPKVRAAWAQAQATP